MTNVNQRISKLKDFSEFSSILSIIIGFTVFTGWIFDITIFKSISPSYSTIEPSTALSFILIGISLWLLQTNRVNHRNQKTAQLLALIVLTIGVLAIIEHLFNFNVSLDHMMEAGGIIYISSSGIMAFSTAINLILISLAILVFDKETDKGYRPSEFLGIAVGYLTIFVIIGYIYQTAVYSIYLYITMAIYSAFTFIIIVLGILSARPDKGIMEILISNKAGSNFGRKILLAIIISPLVLGWLRLLGQDFLLYDTKFGITLMVFFTILILTVLVTYNIVSTNKVDDKRLKAEKELKKLVEELKHSNYELEQFTYITSHDLQEPLRTIASFTQLMEIRYKNKLDQDADEYIEFIVIAAKRMKMMIQGLIEYSQIGTSETRFKPVDTKEVLDITLSILNSAIGEINAVITHDPLPAIMGNKRQLVKLFQNLIGNSIKYRNPSEQLKIHISARKDEENNEYVFSIKDNGIGMEKKYGEKIFEIFKRLHTIDKYAGTGIGLAIAKRIVEHQNGKIWVESEPGRGSTFYFTLKSI